MKFDFFSHTVVIKLQPLCVHLTRVCATLGYILNIVFKKDMKHGIDIRSKRSCGYFRHGSIVFGSFYKLNKTLLVAVFLHKCNFAVNVWLFATGISCLCGCLLMGMVMKQPFLSTPTKSAAVALASWQWQTPYISAT